MGEGLARLTRWGLDATRLRVPHTGNCGACPDHLFDPAVSDRRNFYQLSVDLMNTSRRTDEFLRHLEEALASNDLETVGRIPHYSMPYLAEASLGDPRELVESSVSAKLLELGDQVPHFANLVVTRGALGRALRGHRLENLWRIMSASSHLTMGEIVERIEPLGRACGFDPVKALPIVRPGLDVFAELVNERSEYLVALSRVHDQTWFQCGPFQPAWRVFDAHFSPVPGIWQLPGGFLPALGLSRGPWMAKAQGDSASVLETAKVLVEDQSLAQALRSARKI